MGRGDVLFGHQHLDLPERQQVKRFMGNEPTSFRPAAAPTAQPTDDSQAPNQ